MYNAQLLYFRLRSARIIGHIWPLTRCVYGLVDAHFRWFEAVALSSGEDSLGSDDEASDAEEEPLGPAEIQTEVSGEFTPDHSESDSGSEPTLK